MADPGNIVPAGWKNAEDFAKGIDGNRLPATGALAGTVLTVTDQRGTWSLACQTADAARYAGPDGQQAQYAWYEAVEMRSGLFYLTIRPQSTPRAVTVLVVHEAAGRTLAVVSHVRDEPVPGHPRVTQEFYPGQLGVPVTGSEPAPTRDLVGSRALYRYSPNHLYEHVYLSSERYAWQCLVGEQRGHGDVDLASTWKIADELYVFTFREFAIPVAATWLYDLEAGRTVGTFTGLSGAGEMLVAPGGAIITQLGRVDYPDEQPV